MIHSDEPRQSLSEIYYNLYLINIWELKHWDFFTTACVWSQPLRAESSPLFDRTECTYLNGKYRFESSLCSFLFVELWLQKRILYFCPEVFWRWYSTVKLNRLWNLSTSCIFRPLGHGQILQANDMLVRFGSGSLKERGHFADLGAEGKILLKRIVKK